MEFWVTSLLSLAGKEAKQCPSPVPSSALHADLGFSYFPDAIRPSPLMTISHLILHTYKVYFPITKKTG